MTSDTGAKRKYHHGDLRAELLRVAGEMLEEAGPESLSFRAIARGAGVSQTAPYNHFADKAALLRALADQGLSALAESQEKAATKSEAGRERIIALGLDYVRFALTQPQRYRLMFGVGLPRPTSDDTFGTTKKGSFAPIRDAMAEWHQDEPPAEAETAAFTAWALVHGIAMLLLDGSIEADSVNEALDRTRELLVSFTEPVAS